MRLEHAAQALEAASREHERLAQQREQVATRIRAIGHRAGEWMFERHHSMFLRERMGPDLEYHP